MAQFFFFLFLLSATLGTRKLLFQFTPGFHEYEAMFVYLSDFFLVAFLLVSFVRFLQAHTSKSQVQISNAKSISPPEADPPPAGKFKIQKLFTSRFFFLISFLVFVAISIFLAFSKWLAFYNFLRLLLVVAMAFAVARAVRNSKVFRTALAIIAVIAILQSVIGIAQFARQENLGLKWLGESPISVTDGASSKILVNGSRVLRAYGLFPHPNILGAFLVMGFLSLTYFYLRLDRPLYADLFDYKKSLKTNFRSFIRSRHFYLRLVLAAGMFVVLTGLALTFSRSAWLATFIGVIFFLAFQILATKYENGTNIRKRFAPVFRVVIVLLAIGYWLVATFGAFILPRATVSATEPAVNLRLAYNRLAVDLIREHPFGVGIGNEVLYSVKSGAYREHGLIEVWQWQPIHNIYLLAFSEIGVLGGLAFIVFLLSVLFGMTNIQAPMNNQSVNDQMTKEPFGHSGIRSLNGYWSLDIGVSRALLFALLVLGLLDHFFWTIWQGQVLLWLAIGFILAGRNSRERSIRSSIDHV